MSLSDFQVYSVVVGGGFYGANIALFLANQDKGPVVLIEKENDLLSRASFHNQARVHNGYHYPRSFSTAYRSSINLSRFIKDWPNSVHRDFTKIYAIARNNSKVTSNQFARFCKEIGVEIEQAKEFADLFNARLIQEVFLVEEYAFNASDLSIWAKTQLALSNVEVLMNANVTDISKHKAGLLVGYRCGQAYQTIQAEKVFNCTYSGINQVGGDFGGTQLKLKHEAAEIALMQMPESLKKIGITVMDGPFFSIMPFPSRNLHTLSHVRYTPHFNWQDVYGIDPYETLMLYEKQTRVDWMVRDAQRYVPDIAKAEYHNSFFEIKTILTKNETDDGRPILFEQYPDLPGLYSVLGGKIDNIYDILERLGNEK